MLSGARWLGQWAVRNRRQQVQRYDVSMDAGAAVRQRISFRSGRADYSCAFVATR